MRIGWTRGCCGGTCSTTGSSSRSFCAIQSRAWWRSAGLVLCNAHHSVPQRLCRALLMRQERVGGETISVTHEMMAARLGAQRAGVTRAALNLRRAGTIAYERGRVEILDRAALEAQACDCYANLKSQLAGLNLGIFHKDGAQYRAADGG